MSKATRRYMRSILLGVAALAALIWVAVEQFDIPRQEMLELALLTVMVVGGIILAAALALGLLLLLRRLFSSE